MGNRRGIPFWPLYQLLAASRKGGGPSLSHWPQLVAQFGSSIVMEPLRLIETYAFNGAIERQPLRPDPVFVLGHFRSGTTYLQELLAQDSRFGYLNLYEMVFFDISLTTERALKPAFALFAKRLGSVYQVHRMKVDFDIPGEDDFAMLRMGFPESAYWGGVFPRGHRAFFDPYLRFDDPDSPEALAWAKRYRYLVQKLSLLAGGRRLLLKSPPHTARIPVLLKLFPQARFIYIHRNPYDVFASSKFLWEVNAKYGLQELPPEMRQELILDLYERLIGGYLKQRSQIPPGQLIEMRYEELVADPLENLGRIYQTLDLGGFDAAKPRISELVARRRPASPPRHVLSSAEIAAVQSRWRFALEVWPYPAPGSA